MNILIYDLNENLQNLLSKLEQIRNVSIYFAFDENEMRKLISEIQPEIIFVNSESINSHIKEYLMKNKDLNIYFIDDSKITDLDNFTFKQSMILEHIVI